MTLIDQRPTGGQAGVRYAAKLISRFGYLAKGARLIRAGHCTTL